MRDKVVTRAGFFPRAAAFAIDSVLVSAVLLIVRAPAALASLFGGGSLTSDDFLFTFSALDVFCWAVSAAYFTLMTYFTGGTLGKKLLRLRVEGEDGAPLRLIDVIYRETVGRFLSGIMFVGYIMVFFDTKHRAFHDWLCGTAVVYDGISSPEACPAAPPASEKTDPAPPELPAYTIPGSSDTTADAAGENTEAKDV